MKVKEERGPRCGLMFRYAGNDGNMDLGIAEGREGGREGEGGEGGGDHQKF